jgi:RimJ/RimL family protein N-acetyltransferase
MKFPESYKCLNKNIFQKGEYKLVPIRYEDRNDIMKWRNEQMYHLRQAEPLTSESQDNYFNNIVSKLFEEEKPKQILFSYLKNDILIGYGGLVHINWIDNNSEISFVMNTELEEKKFEIHWSSFLNLLEKIAFESLEIHKLSTFAFDLRPHLYNTFETNGYYKEAVLKEHCLFENRYISVVIHSKIK